MSVCKHHVPIWNFFDKSKTDDKMARCHICNQDRSYKSSVTNLKIHLEKKHPKAYRELLQLQKKLPTVPNNIKQIPITYADDVKEELVEEEFLEDELLGEGSDGANDSYQNEDDDSNYEPHAKIQRVTQIYISEEPKAEDDKKRLDLKLLNMIICDFQPFSIVDDIGFRAFINALNPKYELPDQKTLSEYLLAKVYEKRLEEVKMYVQSNAKSVCITVECWTSCSKESYMAITAHFFVDDPFELKSMLIECAEFEGQQVGINIYKEVKSILDTWELYSKVNFIVTDGTPFMDSAANHFAVAGWSHFGCLALKLNQVVQDALSEIKDTLTKVQIIVNHFEKNIIAKEKIIKYQTNVQNVMQPKSLLKSVPTKWDSVFLMLERFVDLQEALRTTKPHLQSDLPMLTMQEWQVVEQSLVILKPFYETTKEMSAEQYLTASKAMVLMKSLIKICDNYSHFEELHTSVKQLANKLKSGMVRRLGDLENNMKIGLSTVLDPRFKLKPIKDPENISILKNELKSKMTDLINKENQTNTSNLYEQQEESEPSTSHSRYSMPIYSLWSEFDAETDKDFAPRSAAGQAAEELQKYLDHSLIKRSECPLKWWQEYKTIYPNLFKLFIEHGNIVATSVPCERLFSKNGHIISDRRARLPSTKVPQLVFLNANKMET
ncbi:hypothetical protein ABMA27_002319 [Loxostege sticticalis]|uniref:BED-type domain-containing protein n=1 Tax=Loxostege sticticalis TaxID=481309 RepID=A0ABR3HXC4_LOXSC